MSSAQKFWNDWVGESVDAKVLLPLVIGFLIMFVPSYMALATQVWSTDEQGHGPIILAVSAWLIYRKRDEIAALPNKPHLILGGLIFVVAVLIYLLGRSQDVLLLDAFAQIMVLAALMLMFKGMVGLKLIWFPLFFLIFMIPLPDTLVAAVTAPLKMAVSTVASSILYHLDYPVGRSGVTLTVGQFQLLVADACSGLNSMFTLEALGLLYMNIMNYKSATRNILLAILIIPTSFVANVVRVMVLVLVTYYYGDEAGQGFVHDFAGMVLFMVGLAIMLVLDSLLNLVFRNGREK